MNRKERKKNKKKHLLHDVPPAGFPWSDRMLGRKWATAADSQ